MTNLYQAQAIPGWPYHVSAGGAVFKATGHQRRYALLYRGAHWHGEESWHLPKGTLENQETLLDCALREVKEEAGLEGKLWGYLGSITRSEKYSDSKIVYRKTTHYFLLEYLSGKDSKIDKEHDRLEWFPAKAAYQKLAMGRAGKVKQEHQIIKRAEQFLESVSRPPAYE